MDELHLGIFLAVLGLTVGGLVGHSLALRWEIKGLRWDVERLERWQKALLERDLQETLEGSRDAVELARAMVAERRAARGEE